MPAVLPVTSPVADTTDAIDGLLLFHVPPGVVELKVTDVPVHNTAVPAILAGNGLTVIGVIAWQPVDNV